MSIERNRRACPVRTYNASVRMQLDIALMPKPFQIDAVNNRDWNLASGMEALYLHGDRTC